MKKVLVIDDTLNIRNLLVKCLRIEGYEVATANDGHSAIDKIVQENFDLIFLDIKLPYFSGTEVLKHIRKIGCLTPVIIITAYASVKNAVECTQMGAVAYLQKPFTAEKVRHVLLELESANKLEGLKSNTYQNKVDKLLLEKKYNEALELLKKVLVSNTLNSEVYYQLAKVCNLLGKISEEVKYRKIGDCLSNFLD